MSRFIKNWDELKSIPNESETHILEVKEYNGWLHAKVEETKEDRNKDWWERLPHLDVYLSTHTFYGGENKHYTKVLQKCGFDVELANWDEPIK